MRTKKKTQSRVTRRQPRARGAQGSTASSNEATRRVLRRAAVVIERTGWWDGKGDMRSDGPHCVLMAISEAAPSIRRMDIAEEALRKFTRAEWLHEWNDVQPDGATVCAALRACAESLA